MLNTSLPSSKREGQIAGRRIVKKTVSVPVIKSSIPLTKLPGYIESWIKDCRAGKVSQSRITNISYLSGKLLWWMQRDTVPHFDRNAIRDFLNYIQDGHTLPEGRWGEPGKTRKDYEGVVGFPVSMRYRAVSTTTVQDYRRILEAFSNWCVREGWLDESPTKVVRRARSRKPETHFHVFSQDEVKRVLDTAKAAGKRDYAIALFLLDTGLREAEVCALNWSDLDLVVRKGAVRHGKGDKPRSTFWSGDTGRALWAWGQQCGIEPDAPVFCAIGGPSRGERLTGKGLYQMTKRWGRDAEVLHCHPHTFRHTFATCFLLAGGNQMMLMELMGHSDLEMTRRYVRFTGMDLAEHARLYSPVTLLKKKR